MKEKTFKRRLNVLVGTAVIYNPVTKLNREKQVELFIEKKRPTGDEIISRVQEFLTLPERCIDFYGGVVSRLYEISYNTFLEYAEEVPEPFEE